jgi:membrane protease YdiL (CAAX protease family)
VNRAPAAVAASVRRRPLTWFLVLTCALSWWGWPFQATVWSQGPPIASFGPFLAALVVLSLTQGRDGVRGLLVRMVRWRVPARSYALAVGLPVVVTAAAVAATVAAGAPTPSLDGWAEIPVVLLLVLLVPGLGGAWEEPGLRGYALGVFEGRFGWLGGPLLLGAFHALWHLPLFVTGDILATDVPMIIAASVVIASVMHSARDSVLIAMLIHATNNAVAGEYASQLFTGTDKSHLGWFTATGWWVVAGIASARRVRRDARATTVDPAPEAVTTR